MEIQTPASPPGKSRGGVDSDVEGYDSLAALALDLRWSWNHAHRSAVAAARSRAVGLHAQSLGGAADGLARISSGRILAEPAFREQVSDLHAKQARGTRRRPPGSISTIRSRHCSLSAYFSMEFMLSEALPIYSGGLGNVAGDQLKAASDLGVPVVGVGLLYQQGYFRQVIDQDGRAAGAVSLQRSRASCRLRRCAQPTASGCGCEIALPGYSVWLRAWQVAGRPA